jgi:hypothetical protein
MLPIINAVKAAHNLTDEPTMCDSVAASGLWCRWACWLCVCGEVLARDGLVWRNAVGKWPCMSCTDAHAVHRRAQRVVPDWSPDRATSLNGFDYRTCAREL